MGAGAACGFGIYYLTSEGLYGTASFAAYILLLWALPFWRKHFRMRLQGWFINITSVSGGSIFIGTDDRLPYSDSAILE